MAFDKDQAQRDQNERDRIKADRQTLVNDTVKLINDNRFSLGVAIRLQEEAQTLLELVERIVLHSRKDCDHRHEYADGKRSLSGCSMTLADIDDAMAVVRKIRGA